MKDKLSEGERHWKDSMSEGQTEQKKEEFPVGIVLER